nr:hypothetical protein [Micromonospora inaquosa]
MFALANGHLGLRGNLDEGEPHSIPAVISTASTSSARCGCHRPAGGRVADRQHPAGVLHPAGGRRDRLHGRGR